MFYKNLLERLSAVFFLSLSSALDPALAASGSGYSSVIQMKSLIHYV